MLSGFDVRVVVLEGSITLVFGAMRDASMDQATPAASRLGPCTRSTRKRTAFGMCRGVANIRLPQRNRCGPTRARVPI
jgi:hypothetical protein